MKIKPLFDRIVIQQLQAKQQTSGGIFLPSASQEKPQMAKVVWVGEETENIKIYVKPGDIIFYSKFAGMEYQFENNVYTIIRQGDILAVLEDGNE